MGETNLRHKKLKVNNEKEIVPYLKQFHCQMGLVTKTSNNR